MDGLGQAARTGAGVVARTGEEAAPRPRQPPRGTRARLDAQWARANPPFLTCEAVVAEACLLAQRLAAGAQQAVISLVERGVLDVSFRLGDEACAVQRMMEKYHDIPMSLADGCLVRMSRLHPGCVVLTLDGDFRFYRRSGRQPVPVRMPDG